MPGDVYSALATPPRAASVPRVGLGYRSEGSPSTFLVTSAGVGVGFNADSFVICPLLRPTSCVGWR